MKHAPVACVLLVLAGCQLVESGLSSPSPVADESRSARGNIPNGQPGGVPPGARLLPPADAVVQTAAMTSEIVGNQDAAPITKQPGQLSSLNPSIPPATTGQTIDLQEALARAGVDNPTIGLALEAVRASEAQQLQAQVLLVPTLSAGASFDWHQGNLLSGQGVIEDVQRQSLYFGGGAGTVGAGTVAFPGISLAAQVGDAIFEPQVANDLVTARQMDAQATRNEVLLEVGTHYLALAGAEARLRALEQSAADFAEIARLTKDHAKVGQGLESDAQRASAELLLQHAAAEGVEEEAAMAAAELARLLNVEPGVRLRAPPISLMELVDPRDNLERLVQIAMLNRPEIAARGADMAALATRLKKEQVRPFLPVLAVGVSAGDFGGGGSQADTSFGHVSGRVDIDATAFWTLQNFGLGNLAVQRQLRAQVGQATADRARVINAVRLEVAEAFAASATRRGDMVVALRRVQISRRGLQQDLARAKNLLGQPIEILDSARSLSTARQDYLRALTEYNQAQLRLFVSLGQPPRVTVQGNN